MAIDKLPEMTNAQMLRLQRSASLQQTGNKTVQQSEKTMDGTFAGMMQQEIQKENGVQFSKHAEMRIQQRGIDVSASLMNSLNEAVEKARAKGAKDTVIIGSQGAFIVNVPNNIVVTTMTEQEMRNNIFTNIDSAVLM